MAYKPPLRAPVPAYKPYRVNAATTEAAVAGAIFDGTSATAVGAPGTVTITITLVDGDLGAVQPGVDALMVDTGAAWELIPGANIGAINVPARTITATFANTHSGTYKVRVVRGGFCGGISFHAAGTTMALALWDGHPNDPNAKQIASITPPASLYFDPFPCAVQRGLFYTYTGGAAGDLTLFALPAIM